MTNQKANESKITVTDQKLQETRLESRFLECFLSISPSLSLKDFGIAALSIQRLVIQAHEKRTQTLHKAYDHPVILFYKLHATFKPSELQTGISKGETLTSLPPPALDC